MQKQYTTISTTYKLLAIYYTYMHKQGKYGKCLLCILQMSWWIIGKFMQCHIAVNYEATKGGRCVVPSCIIMLPDVGMVKTYSKRLEAGNWGPGLLKSHGILDPWSRTFSTSWTVHRPYIFPRLCRKHFSGLVSALFIECKLVHNQTPPFSHWQHYSNKFLE